MNDVTYYYLGIQTMISIGFLYLGFRIVDLLKSFFDILKEDLKNLD